ncbi:NAD(P)H-dependent oxidoreductase [Staphylococcus gallinarum]|uniref:NAD(P)H-dependent oxidoreductase n=1 Tax=Staphylococcus gallinarum TaxID=1293 RepID=UPI001E34BE7C|nr:NAD(P)-dependent oxidoreductase [Staphylococcus gallinarum]MCD8921508.1 NAD(P)-dependent oxidoreductase [Staphylococcus gallinarum]MEB6277893.1 NAD(P)-dependent oxidoreductase [Staphylococcus gallinarum]UEH00040.1 NAD(P)-dependent oxidoreductase [Staphylococcus gallinarum]
MSLYSDLLVKEEKKDFIRVGVIGAGQMGRGLISQISQIPGMIIGGICDISDSNIQVALEGYQKRNQHNHEVKTSTDFKEVINSDLVEVIVDATGVPEIGAQIMELSLESNKHLVLLNVEVDITVGSIMKKKFEDKGLVYTGSAGDEPGVLVELYEFAKSMGLEVVVAGKGKNNKLQPYANPDSCLDEAKAKKMNPKMLAAFQDGTKTMAEMNLLSNAIGFTVDIDGMHGVEANLDNVNEKLNLKEFGGVLNELGVVEYVDGLAPGVFVIVKSENEIVDEELRYLLKVDESHNDHYTLYRPYHLASLETPNTIAKVAMYNDYSIKPISGPISETIARAKKDIKKGEAIDGIGGYCVRGEITSHESMKEKNAFPIGLITKGTIALKDIKKDEIITYENTSLNKDSTIYRLRQEQDEVFK